MWISSLCLLLWVPSWSLSQFLDRSNLPDVMASHQRTTRSYSLCTADVGCLNFTDPDGLADNEQRHFSSRLLFRSINGEDSILIGAMDAAYVLDYSLNITGKINLTSSDRNRCITTLTQFTSLTNVEEYRCHNHIRHFDVLPGRDPETLFICGTNAFFGSCSYVETSTLSAAVVSLPTGESSVALGIVPTDPALFYTGMLRYYNSSDPVLINGLTITTTANHGTIGFRTLSIDTSNEAAVSTMLRTDVTEASFVARPQIIVDIFFHDYTEGTEMSGAQDLVFVAFQEANGQTWQSRIARICKNDIGSTMNGGSVAGETMNYKFPVTFVKASISCRVLKKNTLQLDYHYNRIFDFELVTNSSYGPGESEAMIGYGLFADTGLQPSGSAVCVYSASRSSGSVVNNGLYDIFTRQFVGGVDNNVVSCADGGASRQSSGHTNREIEADMSQIGSPLFVLEGVSLVKLQVDPRQPVIRNGLLDYQDVMFAASDDGEIYKIFVANESSEMRPVISEVIQLSDDSHVYNLDLKDTDDGKMIFVTTNTTVYRVPVSACDRFSYCQDCIEVRDPYCAWDMSTERCVYLPNATNRNSLLQDVDRGSSSGCPPLPSTTVEVMPSIFLVNVTVNVTYTMNVTATDISTQVVTQTQVVSETVVSETVSVSTQVSTKTVVSTVADVQSCSIPPGLSVFSSTVTQTETETETVIINGMECTNIPTSSSEPSAPTDGGLLGANCTFDPIIPVAVVGGAFILMCFFLIIVLAAVCTSYMRLKSRSLSSSQQSLTDSIIKNPHTMENGSH